MKTDLSHLPPEKAEFLKGVADTIVKEAAKSGEPLAFVILFGSYARGDWVHEYYEEGDPEGPYVSDYDIMVIPKNPCERQLGLWEKIRRKASSPNPEDPAVSLFIHNIKFFNKKLKEDEYFYADVKKEGIVLYDSGKFKLDEAKIFTPEQRQKKAQHHYEYYTEKANIFYRMFELALPEADTILKRSSLAFILHQVTESTYAAALLVHTNYMPKLHDLTKLGDRISNREPAYQQAFPKETVRDKHIFDLLQRAYIDSRYNESYQVSIEELLEIAKRIKAFQEFTEKLCRAKIASFTQSN